MANLLVRPFHTEIQYQGQYADLAFDILAAPTPTYQNLLKFLGKYGATLRDLKYDALTIADANISCTLLNLSTIIRFYADRFEVLFAKAHEIGSENAIQIGLSAWAALQASSPKITLLRHEVSVAFHAELVKGTVDDAMKQYITPPKALGEKTTSAVGFSMTDRGGGEERSRAFIERSVFKEGALYMKLTALFDATHVPFEKLGDRADQFVTTTLGQLGLELERATQA